MTREERNAVARIKRLLWSRHLLFVEVGARVADDRAIETLTELPSGVTVNSREYLALLRDLVRCARGKR